LKEKRKMQKILSKSWSFVMVAVLSSFVVVSCTNGSEEMSQFDVIDLDNSGSISLEEYADFWSARFDAVDQDENGEISPDEFVVYMVKIHGSQDANKDSFVVLKEIGNAVLGEVSEMDITEVEAVEVTEGSHFDMMDIDDDGLVSEEEYTAEVVRWIEVADKDGDEKRSEEEMKMQMTWLVQNKLDADNNQVITEAELLSHYVGE